MKLRDKIQTTVQHDLSDDFIINLFFDGIEEITQRVIALDPSKAETFIYKTSERYSLESTPSTEQQESALKVFGDIVSVLVSWDDKLQANPVQGYHHRLRMSADKIPLEDYGDALDPKSFKYRGKGNPGYVLKKERNLTQNNEGQNHSSYNCVYVVPDPRTYGGEIEIHQVMYNIHPEYRGAFSSGSFENLFKNPLDDPIGQFKLVISGTISPAFEFPVRFQYVLFLYVITQILNIKILDAGANEEDEELVETLREAKKEYQTKYDEFFQYLGAKPSQKEEEDQT